MRPKPQPGDEKPDPRHIGDQHVPHEEKPEDHAPQGSGEDCDPVDDKDAAEYGGDPPAALKTVVGGPDVAHDTRGGRDQKVGVFGQNILHRQERERP